MSLLYAVLAVQAVICALAIWDAPEGYEDATGFHFGKDLRNSRISEPKPLDD